MLIKERFIWKINFLKKIITLFLFLISSKSEAKFGWSFSNYSILFGKQYTLSQNSLSSFEIQYDYYKKSCTERGYYLGMGLCFNYTENQSEYGIKGMYNPTRVVFGFSRNFKIYPYIFGQLNLENYKIKDPISYQLKSINYFGFRPGIGFKFNFREQKSLNFTTNLQIGYNTIKENKKPFTLEIKIGMGINATRLKNKKSAIKS